MSGRRREQLVDIAQWGDVRSLVEDDEQRRVEGLAETRSLLERDIERLADKGDEDRAESSLISRWRTAVERARSIAQQPASLEPPARTLGVGNVWIGISGDHRLRGGIDRGALALFHRKARASDAGGVASLISSPIFSRRPNRANPPPVGRPPTCRRRKVATNLWSRAR